MWICRNCETENEENFKFCWSCGQTREKSKTVEIKEVEKEVSEKPLPKKEPVREVKPVEEIKTANEIKPIETTNVEKRKPRLNEPELFATVLPYAARTSDSSDEANLEVKVFRIAVRLAGLFLLYQVFVALPDLITAIVWEFKNRNELSDPFSKDLIIPLAKHLFYFITGIYLIASGRVLIRLLPD